jgi:hypothetical protein
MLKAFDRLLAIYDRSTYDKAMAQFEELLPGRTPDGAYVDLTADSRETHPINLAAAPDFSDVRSNINVLVENILSSEGGPEEDTDE